VYTVYEGGLVEGRDDFPLLWVVGENALYLATWSLAAFLLWPVWHFGGVPVLGLAWIFLVLVVQTLLKKHNCTGCVYYGKRCHLGWGKLAAWLFERDSGDPATGQRLSLFYILSPPFVLLAGLGYGLLGEPNWLYWAGLGLFVVLNAVTFPVRRSGCSRCKMRKVCLGSAART
jgi:drug/metabolite transporter (DMT)-like permease